MRIPQEDDSVEEPKSFWLTTPFLVLAVVVASLIATPLLLEHHAAMQAQPARAALSQSVQALDALSEMREQHPAAARPDDAPEALDARRRISSAARSYAAVRADSGDEVLLALDGFVATPEAPAARVASARFESLIADRIASERRRVLAAAARIDEVGSTSLSALDHFGFFAGLAGIGGGLLAAMLVWRYQRLSERLRRREHERASELEQFAGRVAQDIVDPLGPVTAGVHMLSERLRGDTRGQLIADTVRRSVDRVAATVDGLLRFAMAGGQGAPDESADLAQVLDAVRAELLPEAQARGVLLTFEPAPHVRVACAEAAMVVVLENLVRNAIKFVGAGPRKIIRASANVIAGKVRLVVQDTGPGIPQGMEAAIFQPFVRLDETGEPGSGLGLATVKRIVESRDGCVGVSSAPRKGSTFWVELPLVTLQA